MKFLLDVYIWEGNYSSILHLKLITYEETFIPSFWNEYLYESYFCNFSKMQKASCDVWISHQWLFFIHFSYFHLDSQDISCCA